MLLSIDTTFCGVCLQEDDGNKDEQVDCVCAVQCLWDVAPFKVTGTEVGVVSGPDGPTLCGCVR